MEKDMLLVLSADNQLAPAEWFRLILRQEFEKRKK